MPEARIRDPVYGCVGLISFIQHQNKWLQQDTDILKEQLGSYVSPQAMLSTLQQPQQTQFMPQTQQPQFMLQSQTQQTSFMPLSHEQFPTMIGHQNLFEAQDIEAANRDWQRNEIFREYAERGVAVAASSKPTSG
ncbi:hypothetical protein HID58_032346 [Brassica napus]|uniref:LOB domain-containing protein n=1 Tax=Brassica napus TaxID=3708 RepID=A0ABQ8BXP8_BRANA|nr:hypothetical protein HID58_094497 [Brassica napus]KAH0909025.1 hypothetical protein HID58_032346 [Brassica napus]